MPPLPEPDPAYVELVEKLRAAVAENPVCPEITVADPVGRPGDRCLGDFSDIHPQPPNGRTLPHDTCGVGAQTGLVLGRRMRAEGVQEIGREF